MSRPVPASAPRFSLISAVYDVARYLPDFIESIEAQDFPLDRVEVIVVDDGSRDDSPRLLAEWQRRRPGLVTVLTKTNGGQASARNLGLEHARGEWVSMPDPDDVLAPDYLSRVDAFLRRRPDTELVATNRILWDEATGRRSDHPLAGHFAYGDRLRDLDASPRFFFGSAPAAFFRGEVLRREGLRLDERIRPNFEDGHFCTSYLLRVPRPLVGFVRSAEYLYRKRADGSSTLNTSKQERGRYTAVLRHGYLDALEQAKARLGRVPEWLQNFVLYELSWYFQAEDAPTRASVAIEAVADEFHELLPRIAALVDPQVVAAFSVRRFLPVWRDILVHGYDPQPWHTPYAVVDKVDLQQHTMRVVYRFTHELPAERWTVDGIATAPLHAKIRAQPYFRRSLVQERIAWVPYGTLTLELDGHPLELRVDEPEPVRYAMEGWRPRDAHRPARAAGAAPPPGSPPPLGLRSMLLLAAARSRPVRYLLRRSWVLADRIEDADDSAEHLFRWLRRHRRRAVNAWFVIARGTPDFHRLRRRYGWRVVPHGSIRWRLIMINCTQLVSSHADAVVSHPHAIMNLLGGPTWRFVFLQHGVTKDDLSPWLNGKDIDVFVVSTPGEYRALVDDGTAYRYTTREAALTGLPRFDAIKAAGDKVEPARRDLLLVAPTWRHWLTLPRAAGQTDWPLDTAAFDASDFARCWRALLTSPELSAAAERRGLRVAVLMHPILRSAVERLDLPSEILRLGFDDVRHTFARARVLVTDYSSMAFNAAYIDRPVVYFQFDRELMLGGGHVGRRGYYDYERDGFGPVTRTVDEAVAATVRAIDAGPEPQAEYAQRIRAAFPARDGRCCERTADAIAAGATRVPWDPEPVPDPEPPSQKGF